MYDPQDRERSVLDHGRVRLVTFTPWDAPGLIEAALGAPLSVEEKARRIGQHDIFAVNAARASFDAESESLEAKDLRLLRFLAEAKPVPHTAPFRHAHVTLEVYAPLFVCRQWWRHVIGAPLTEGTPWSELSRRYVRGELEFYTPHGNEWRRAPENAKQGSGDLLPLALGFKATATALEAAHRAVAAYEELLELGVAPEMARMILPQNLYTSFRWSPSIQALAAFLVQRLDDHAQVEIRQFAQAVVELVRPIFPHSIGALAGAAETA